MEQNSVSKPSFWKSYWFIFCMMAAIIAGTILGLTWPKVTAADGTVVSAGATVLEPMGTLFINAMFCVVVPMVFVSISSAIANMKGGHLVLEVKDKTLEIVWTDISRLNFNGQPANTQSATFKLTEQCTYLSSEGKD